MGLFDGILFCSDFDGTLAVKGKISKENCDAILEFYGEAETGHAAESIAKYIIEKLEAYQAKAGKR